MNRLLKRTYSDMRDLARDYDWQLDFCQLDAGELSASAEMFRSEHLKFMRVDMDKRFHQTGDPARDSKTFGVVDPMSADIDWCRHRLHVQDLADFNHPGGFDGVSRESHRAFTFTLSNKQLETKATALGIDYDDLLNASLHGKIAFADVADSSEIRAHLAQAVRCYDRLHPGAQALLIDELTDRLSTAVLVGSASPDPACCGVSDRNGRQLICRRAVDYLHEHIQEPVQVSDLCQATGVSVATLERAFRAYFGVTPKRYISYRRLNAVARALANYPERTVTEIAGHWGFWHMGQFGRDIRNFTGRLPSDIQRPTSTDARAADRA